jgi:4-alpha-glucanotransferase
MAPHDPRDHEDAVRELAAEYGVAVDFWDWQGRQVLVALDTMVAVLGALGVDASTEDAARAALHAKADEAWRRMLPPVLVTRQGWRTTFDVHVPEGWPVDVWVELETGEHGGGVDQRDNWDPPRTVDGELVGEATFAIAGDLPLGYHWVHARTGDRQARMSLVVTPHWVGMPERLGERRVWGLATQLYGVRSAGSWGTGDLTDLTDLGVWAAVEHGADYVLVNPLHAAEPVVPMEPSPYLPTTRRFGNPMYLRPERIPEHAGLTPADRAALHALHERAGDPVADRIDRDTAWRAKRAALHKIFEVRPSAGRDLAFEGYRRREGGGLDHYATWAAIAEVHGADTLTWPAELRHPGLPAVARFREEHADAVEFHQWLQWVLDEQLAATQLELRRSGMGLGVMTDLAVGVHWSGADAWSLQETYAAGVTVGAPPDPYNQNGQDWQQPPWRPDRLADTAYEPFRRLVSAALRNAGGLRVDHVIGLFRLWWIPKGAGPTAGTYVRYDHEAMIGILALEAHRADAVVVGEDLGTVEPWVRTYLAERGILGTSILWFEMDHDGGGGPLAAERWREWCLASVTTHDLPPTAGYLAGDHVRLRDSLGLLTRPVEEELAVDAVERQAWLGELQRVGLLPADGVDRADGADVETTVQALHAYLAGTPSRLRCVALTDAVGDRRTQNQPGTIDEYPNWRDSDAARGPVHQRAGGATLRGPLRSPGLVTGAARLPRPAQSASRLDRPDHVAEGDPAAARARGRVAEHDLVAVLEEGTTAGHRLLPAPAELEERPALARLGSADRAGREQVARAGAGAVDGQVGEHLGR